MAVEQPAPAKVKLPPLWLSASAVAAGITVAFGIRRWIDHFVSEPDANDLRGPYVAAEIGLKYGWSHIYDRDLQRALSAGFGPLGSVISPDHNYVGPPLLAWLVLPIEPLPLPIAFLIWTLICLAALIFAWWLVAPGKGLARITLLLVALALYPVHYSFWLGQTVVLIISLLLIVWWLLERQRWAAAGALLAIGLFVKPQHMLLLPVALLITGRWRPVAYCALVTAAIAIVSVVSLGSDGIAAWLNSIAYTNASPIHSGMTYAYIFGRGPLATGIGVSLGLIALALAWYRRDRPDLVFGLAIVGSTASAFYLHEYDPAVLIAPAWIVLRHGVSLPQRVWLLFGIVAAQFIAIALPIPMLLWEAIWIGMLGLEPWLSARTRPLRQADATAAKARLSG